LLNLEIWSRIFLDGDHTQLGLGTSSDEDSYARGSKMFCKA
jgi:hypothetical protein